MAAKGGERVTYDNDFIFIGQSKQCARMREHRGVLKIKIYAQRLTHRVCMEDGSSCAKTKRAATIQRIILTREASISLDENEFGIRLPLPWNLWNIY